MGLFEASRHATDISRAYQESATMPNVGNNGDYPEEPVPARKKHELITAERVHSTSVSLLEAVEHQNGGRYMPSCHLRGAEPILARTT